MRGPSTNYARPFLRQPHPSRSALPLDPSITGNYRAVQRFYADGRLWTTTDTWHSYVDRRIGALLRRICSAITPSPRLIANIGSGGNSYEIVPTRQIHIDVLAHRLAGMVGALARAEALPLRSGTVDLALCVGSVINHGDAASMIAEIGRILRPGALAVIECDVLDGLHRSGRSTADGVRLVDTFFNGRMFILAEYSRGYVERAIASAGLAVECRHSFHIASGLPLRFGVPPALAAHLIHLDPILRRVPSLRYRGCNLLLVARRVGSGAV